MMLKTFRAKSMVECLSQIKRELGKDAVILSTRTVSRGGLLGMGARHAVEVTAARSIRDLPKSITGGRLRPKLGSTDKADGAANSVPEPTPTRNDSTELVLSELSSLKSLVSNLVKETRRGNDAEIPERLFDHYLQLVQNALADHLARDLVQRVREELSGADLENPEQVRRRLAAFIEPMLPTAGPIRIGPIGEPTIVALIGPTGVGKTTTIAKLAANFCLREQRTVGLITIDTYRIAAVEQLRTYAQIIDVPLDVVNTPDQLRDAVARRADRDILLIDTAGRSQRDLIKIKELQRFFHAVRPHEVHLVLSGAASESVLQETIHRFKEVGVDRLIFTKLDEAIGFGVIASCLAKASAKLSYVTAGQDVPDDITIADAGVLARSILGDVSPVLR